MSVARGLARFRSEPGHGAFRAWLHKIVRRRIADYRRREVHAPAVVGGSSFAMRLAELPSEDSFPCVRCFPWLKKRPSPEAIASGSLAWVRRIYIFTDIARRRFWGAAKGL